MTAKKMLHGREFKISCGRFDRKISVEVDGKPAKKSTARFSGLLSPTENICNSEWKAAT